MFNSKNKAIWLQALFFILLLLFLNKINPFEIVVIYALETIIIGVFHVIKLLSFGYYSKNVSLLKTIIISIFFVLHYGLFAFVQTTFIFIFMSLEDERITSGFGLTNYETVLSFSGVQIALSLLIISCTIKYFTTFYKKDINQFLSIEAYMFQPYLRVFIQQIVIIIPAIFIIFGKAGIAIAILLILIRLFIDIIIFNMTTENVWLQKIVNYIYVKDAKTSKKQIEKFLHMLTNE